MFCMWSLQQLCCETNHRPEGSPRYHMFQILTNPPHNPHNHPRSTTWALRPCCTSSGSRPASASRSRRSSTPSTSAPRRRRSASRWTSPKNLNGFKVARAGEPAAACGRCCCTLPAASAPRPPQSALAGPHLCSCLHAAGSCCAAATAVAARQQRRRRGGCQQCSLITA